MQHKLCFSAVQIICFIFSLIGPVIKRPTIQVRWLSAAQVATALRPFYFAVHPDLFGKYPAARVSITFH